MTTTTELARAIAAAKAGLDAAMERHSRYLRLNATAFDAEDYGLAAFALHAAEIAIGDAAHLSRTRGALLAQHVAAAAGGNR